MKSRFALAAIFAAMVGLVSSSALANTVYNLNISSGDASAVGTITTDSTLGSLQNSNILDWQIDLKIASDTFSLNGTSNSGFFVEAAGVTATATGLFFDFGATDQTALIFQSPHLGAGLNSYDLCFNDTTGACSADPSLVNIHMPFNDRTFSIGSGVQKIASVAATPLPAALPLFASAIGGLGFVGWPRKRTA